MIIDFLEKAAGAALAISATFFALNTPYFGQLDGYLLPVTDGLTLEEDTIEVSDGPDSVVSFKATATILRSDCEWRATEWFLGKPGKSVSVRAAYYDRPQIRPAGKHEWHQWVRLDLADLQANSYALVYHDCYWGWTAETVTLHYRGESQDD